MYQTDSVLQIVEQMQSQSTHVGEFLSLIFQNLPVGLFWKDTRSYYLGANQFHAKIAGLKSERDIIGLSDFNLSWTEEEAEQFQRDDQKIIATGNAKINFIESHHRQDGEKYYVKCTKVPLYGPQKEIIGLLGFFYDVQYESARVDDFKTSDLFCDQEHYYLGTDGKAMRLTARQAECLVHLSMGKTNKQIAKILGCSPRTIEDHINLLKNKLGVCSTERLIDYFWRNPIKWF